MKARPISDFARRRIAKWTPLLLICVSNLSGCRMGNPSAPTRSKQLFENCASCHGTNGAGNRAMGAPNIGGMNDWYVERQLENFRNGTRGSHFSDAEGLRMGPMARSLATDQDVKEVAHYVGGMLLIRRPASVPGDAKAGATSYAPCAACHGVHAEGNPALKAPRLAGTDDWYLTTQLKKFRSGVRGTNPNDVGGLMMRPMALSLSDEDAIRNVVAYIDTLEP